MMYNLFKTAAGPPIQAARETGGSPGGPHARSEFLSCDGLGISPWEFIVGMLRAYPAPTGWLPFEESAAAYLYKGRYAIYALCQSLGIGAGDEVLIPAYNCGAEVDPFIAAGARVIFYRVDEKAMLDPEDILRRATSSTKLMYVTHYFGWPQKMEAVARWCRRKGIILLEDCAQALFSSGQDNCIGRTGDAVVYSLVKSLPVPDGGVLAIRNKNIKVATTRLKSPRNRYVVLNSLPLVKKWLLQKNTTCRNSRYLHQLLKRKRPAARQAGTTGAAELPFLPEHNYFDMQKSSWSISRLTKNILFRLDSEKIVALRRRNYQHLADSIGRIPGAEPLFDFLPDMVCPLSFPLLVKNRPFWFSGLESCGIPVTGWPAYHRSLSWEGFPEARYLKNNIIALPVDQSLSPRHMTYISECFKKTAEANAAHNR